MPEQKKRVGIIGICGNCDRMVAAMESLQRKCEALDMIMSLPKVRDIDFPVPCMGVICIKPKADAGVPRSMIDDAAEFVHYITQQRIQSFKARDEPNTEDPFMDEQLRKQKHVGKNYYAQQYNKRGKRRNGR